MLLRFSPIHENQTTWSIEGEGDGFSPRKNERGATVKVQVATRINFYDIDVTKPVTKFQEDIKFAKNLKLPQDFQLTIPTTREFGIQSSYEGYMPKGVITNHIIDDKEYIVLVHHGIKGSYITGISEKRIANMHCIKNDVDTLSIAPTVKNGSVTDFTIKAAFTLVFDNTDGRYLPSTEEAKTFLNEKPKQEVKEESNPIWDILKNIK